MLLQFLLAFALSKGSKAKFYTAENVTQATEKADIVIALVINNKINDLKNVKILQKSFLRNAKVYSKCSKTNFSYIIYHADGNIVDDQKLQLEIVKVEKNGSFSNKEAIEVTKSKNLKETKKVINQLITESFQKLLKTVNPDFSLDNFNAKAEEKKQQKKLNKEKKNEKSEKKEKKDKKEEKKDKKEEKKDKKEEKKDSNKKKADKKKEKTDETNETVEKKKDKKKNKDAEKKNKDAEKKNKDAEKKNKDAEKKSKDAEKEKKKADKEISKKAKKVDKEAKKNSKDSKKNAKKSDNKQNKEENASDDKKADETPKENVEIHKEAEEESIIKETL